MVVDGEREAEQEVDDGEAEPVAGAEQEAHVGEQDPVGVGGAERPGVEGLLNANRLVRRTMADGREVRAPDRSARLR